MKDKEQIIEEWFDTIYDTERFLNFAEFLNINEFTVEKGEKVIWLEDGMHYIAHGERIGEYDGEKAKAIIETLQDCGVEFINKDDGDRALDELQGREQSWRDGSMLGSPFTTMGNNYD